MLNPETIKDLKKREQKARLLRASGWESEWKDIAALMAPERLKYFNSGYTPGMLSVDRSGINNDSFMRNIEVCLSGLKGGSIPHSLPWFKLAVFDEDIEDAPGVKEWLHTVQRWAYSVFSRSNFYDKMTQPYYEAMMFSTSAFTVDTHPEEIIFIEPWTLGTYSLLAGEEDNPDVAFRGKHYPLRLLANKYGLEALSPQRRAMLQNNKDAYVEVIQAIFPRKDYDERKVDSVNMPIASVWWEVGGDEDKILEESGYREKNLMVNRWDTIAGEVWGIGCPGMKNKQNVKALQVLERDSLLISGQKGRPAMNLPSKQRGRLQIHPGAQNWMSDKESETVRRTLDFDPDGSSIDAKIAVTLENIERGFYNDLFLMLANDDTTQKTAYEIARKHDEKLAILSPTLERLNRSGLSPTLSRLIAHGLRKGYLPEPPEALEGESIKVEYVSILAQAQKAAGIKTSEQLIDFVGRVAGVKEEAIDKIDFDVAIDDYAENIGANPSIVRRTKDAMGIRQSRQEQQAQGAQMEQAGQMASVAKDLGQAQTGEGESLLSELTKSLPAP